MTTSRSESVDGLRFRQSAGVDHAQLAALRWDMRMEDGDEPALVSRDVFEAECRTFFAQSGRMHVHWLAERDGEILSTISVHMVDMLPRPCKLDDRFGCITNNYTRPEWRGRGIATQLLRHVTAWAAAEDLELLIVWPSALAVPFYTRSGFACENEVMELRLREYVPIAGVQR
ncbi:MAG TPA: GNAT family N-acetyltransferase [Allosphingosinicella sp.]|jgi:GNAT superfamily N-acetyltransferase